MNMKKTHIILLFVFLCININLINAQHLISKNVNDFSIKFENKTFDFFVDFVVFYNEKDPSLALKPGNFKKTLYNIPTWLSKENNLKKRDRTADQVGDGFDDSILNFQNEKRTANLFLAPEEKYYLKAISNSKKENQIKFIYKENEKFSFSAEVIYSDSLLYPLLKYTLTPKVNGFFSVGYIGSPQVAMSEAEEIWQPLIWQEKRFPDNSYITLAFRAPIPSTFVSSNGFSWGVVANPDEFPFDPLPLFNNSRFGIALRNQAGNAQPMIFAPVLGGIESKMKTGVSFSFSSILYIGKGKTTKALEDVAVKIYGFNDLRRNSISTLNNTIDNIIDYSLSKYAYFVDEEKGCGYSTDLPGAVKNVSSLNPLDIALITDNVEMLEKRAYPIMEYMLSRDKFLFIADSTKKTQFPSHKLTGPCAPISELSSLYNILGKNNPHFLTMAKKEFNNSRIRNLDVLEQGNSWKNALALYMGTLEKKYLDLAIAGADEYIEKRMENSPTDFNDPYADGMFFWMGFTPKWIELFLLYEYTKNLKYLHAAHQGAKLYSQFIWYSPLVPDKSILVNKGGIAPLYGYLAKGRVPMQAHEEFIPAWRLSEIGLTPESSGTSTGHRAIFMANYAPWMLKIGYLVKDTFLINTAKAAIIGRSRNFPGYHINTERTSIYEKENYPYHTHQELSVNSFHYNHILPMISMLFDYLVSDVYVKSNSKIKFESYYIEGFAYLKNMGYGGMHGTFYNKKGVSLWMPKNLVKVNNVELNYLACRTENSLCIALVNQSNENIDGEITIDVEQVIGLKNKIVTGEVWIQNKKEKNTKIVNGQIKIPISSNGISAVVINNIAIATRNIDTKIEPSSTWKYPIFETPNIVSQVINFYDKTNIFNYVKLPHSDVASISLTYNGVTKHDDSYPFEITVTLPKEAKSFVAVLDAKSINGDIIYSENVVLKK